MLVLVLDRVKAGTEWGTRWLPPLNGPAQWWQMFICGERAFVRAWQGWLAGRALWR